VRLPRRKAHKLFVLEPLPRALPHRRRDCENGARPCPYVSCRHHLYLDVKATGSIVLNFPRVDPANMRTASCSLDVADRGGVPLRDVATLLSLSHERVRQIEVVALRKVRAKLGSRVDWFGER
jgi:hypothetical protein